MYQEHLNQGSNGYISGATVSGNTGGNVTTNPGTSGGAGGGVSVTGGNGYLSSGASLTVGGGGLSSEVGGSANLIAGSGSNGVGSITLQIPSTSANNGYINFVVPTATGTIRFGSSTSSYPLTISGNGSLTTTGAISAGALTIANSISTGTLTTSGVLTTSGLLTANGGFTTSKSILVGGLLTTGVITAGGFSAGNGGYISTTGAVSAGTLTTSGLLTANGGLTTSGTITAGSLTSNGNITISTSAVEALTLNCTNSNSLKDIAFRSAYFPSSASLDPDGTMGTIGFTDDLNMRITNNVPGGNITIWSNINVNIESMADVKILSANFQVIKGNLYARQVVVQTGTFPDYVFKPGYKLKSLAETEAYIKANGHLEDMPDEAMVKEKGINVAEMNAALLKKIEEITLLMIEQNKRVEALEKENGALKTKVEEISNK